MTRHPGTGTHFECNCVPALGPPHCHQCSDEVSAPVGWRDCRESFTEDWNEIYPSIPELKVKAEELDKEQDPS